ncbi:ComF family protein [Neobacillus notoginsengisoli]|uniref:ComF family protein n=1 Tax=Neobacillus notoginsengisoli TaxID=1578198 RepID=A0A417YRJ6_9BACI|nr:ComF family protein [Neobacillus notoginsengisoli]RHW37339.1 ComF family protein [Neobacillus notoginsengisoli]
MLFETQLCLLCGGEAEEEESWSSLFSWAKDYCFCKNCMGRLARIDGETCRICGRAFTENEQKFRVGDLCGDCDRWEQDDTWSGLISANVSLYSYNDFLKDIIARFKYRGDYMLAKAFGDEARAAIKKLKPDVITPIPLSPERLYERGFNQAEAILEQTGFKWNLLLSRVHGEKQSKKSRSERIHVPQVFKLAQLGDLDGCRILLVDDIYTTGSTLRHAAKLLREAGAGDISSFTIARG